MRKRCARIWKWRDEEIRGGDGILNGEVDADAADGRHGVSGVSDAEQARGVPATEVIDLDGERLELGEVGELVDAGVAVAVGLGEDGDELGEVAA